MAPKTSLRKAVPLLARLALLSLVLQISGLGHWSLGPVQAEKGDLAEHTSHCHGNASGCAGESSLVGSLAEASLTPAAPLARINDPRLSTVTPADAFLPTPDEPPRSL